MPDGKDHDQGIDDYGKSIGSNDRPVFFNNAVYDPADEPGHEYEQHAVGNIIGLALFDDLDELRQQRSSGTYAGTDAYIKCQLVIHSWGVFA